jgi:hypothetical protein
VTIRDAMLRQHPIMVSVVVSGDHFLGDFQKFWAKFFLSTFVMKTVFLV